MFWPPKKQYSMQSTWKVENLSGIYFHKHHLEPEILKINSHETLNFFN